MHSIQRESILTFVAMLFVSTCRRSVTAFQPRVSHLRLLRPEIGREASSVITRFYSSSNFSASTRSRVDGLDAADEFSKLATKLGVPPTELADTLKQRLSLTDQRTDAGLEKAEYLEWLLIGSSSVLPGKIENLWGAKPGRIPASSLPNKKELTSTTTPTSTSQTFSTKVLFASRDDLHPNSKRAVAEMGLTEFTEIQDKTFAVASSGRDVLGRARTGTGKTVAFLLPAIERILQLGVLQNQDQIGVLIVSPTRELATQIGDQAEKLAKFHRGMSVQVIFGGTNSKRDITRLSQKTPTILVATPGRLLDHLQSTRIGNKRFGKDIMCKTPIVVLDETDRLLDMGFRQEITKILGYMPHPHERQTLLFSATIPPDLKVVMSQNMKKDFVEVDCINDGDASTHTNAQVQQSHLIIPSDSGRSVSCVVELVRRAMEQYDSPTTPAKIVVFFPTARLVNFYSEIFNEGKVLPFPVLELHSKKTQGYRNRVSEDFRNAKRAVLFTSDVSARGVDYPNVSHVIQFGIPESREQYIHRLGRTGRGGTTGRGWLVLNEWESPFLQELKGVEIPENEDLRSMIANPMDPHSEKLVENIRNRIAARDRVLATSASGAYQAFLGFYVGQMKRMRVRGKEELVDIANDFALLCGLGEPPALNKQTVGKMGLKGVTGLNIGAGESTHDGRSMNVNRGNKDANRSNGGTRRDAGGSRDVGDGKSRRR